MVYSLPWESKKARIKKLALKGNNIVAYVFATRSGSDVRCEYLLCCSLGAGFNFGCISGKNIFGKFS
jgi:hypothetical protein